MQTLSARRLDMLLAEWRGTAPAYSALADRVRLLILDGRIPIGTRLPAERELAQQLHLSRTTVSATFARLRDAGYLSSTRGSGSVAMLPAGEPVAAELPGQGLLDFSKAALPAAHQLADAATRAAASLPTFLGSPGYDPVGLPQLRQAIADRYAARGLPTDPAQVMVTIGAQHAIALLSRVILDRSDTAVVETPSYPHAYEALRSAARRLVPVNVTTSGGWDEDALRQAFARTHPALAYVMPDFQNPTGCTMGSEQRTELLRTASKHGTVVVADETMAELAIDDDGARPLPLAAYGPAVLIGSLGKTVWGGLRIGWIRAEPDLVQRLVRARFSHDLGTPILEQLIAADVLGQYESILAERGRRLREGRDQLASLLRDRLPGWDVPGVRGGLALWVGLGQPVSSQLTLAARNEGLLLAAGPRFGLDGAFERFLRIPFSYPEEQTERAVDILARCWKALPLAQPSETGYLAEVV
ncbi:DNA-binding transcriptional MocR family regulator [Arthrobacter pigmenti]|uniref:DNA-binding transcriptional MocR family regulator n=1 Tax=Arthrobacter pigmenti TaxID=271432 RepID=A0A846RLZ9_9MICC|nr:PLP-dependent aminotransferase family protein [Arthrobacter pigmenti]NJC21324.1 DNA-binding transcriptional MocR family regulator [Arthrobacter pigmenti]